MHLFVPKSYAVAALHNIVVTADLEPYVGNNYNFVGTYLIVIAACQLVHLCM